MSKAKQIQTLEDMRMRCPKCNEFVSVDTFNQPCKPHPLLGPVTHGFWLNEAVKNNRKINSVVARR